MPEEVEVETKDLQEAISEAHEHHEEGGVEKDKKKAAPDKQATWIRYIALTTAVFAVFAAIGAMQSGAFVNEAMMLQIKASDTWSEYQASRQKEYLFTTQADALLDRGVLLSPNAGKTRATPTSENKAQNEAPREEPVWKGLTPPERLAQFIGSASKEHGKTVALKEKAEKYEKDSETLIERHHRFARSVALIQVAIALAAIAALTRVRLVWGLSMAVGLIGLYFFVQGTLAR